MSESAPLLKKASSQAKTLPACQRFLYSMGHVLNDLTASMWFSYLIIYFHQVKQFNNVLAGYLMLIGQVSDALFTPFIGFESDRTQGFLKIGKRKSWHLIGTICVACSFPFIFNECITCGHAQDGYQFIYYAPFVIIFQFGWASTQISHLSLIPDLTTKEDERVELNGMRYAFTVLSNLAVFGLFALLFYLNTGDDVGNSDMLSPADNNKFRDLVFIVVSLGVVVSFLFQIGVKEGVKTFTHVEAEEAMSKSMKTCSSMSSSAGESGQSIEISMMRQSLMSWKDWLKESQFYQVALIYMCTRLFVNVSQIYLPLYVTETLQLSKVNVAIMPLVVFVSGLFTSLVMKPINKAIGRKATYLIGLLCGLGACIWIYFLDKSTKHYCYGVSVFLGIGGSTMLVTSLAMTSDLIGQNTESGAFVYGAMSFTDKLSNGLAVVLIQHNHPCTSCCPLCNQYFKTVLTFVPGGVVLLAFVVLCTLIPTKIGTKKKGLVCTPQPCETSAASDE
ncbi:major facilitator superfamily domain-containing protein 12-like isoform X2 [Mizuhopecten yessoensis]|uniref:major facilitator superfamily domain-containing protein 12-like isoform X2 n=1 Tax=Mizuhopecten yessoensis TaxID=6573 RepID=UPI000B45B6DD|nr:major facilitator superfamily domain-containing protein 12-like isoform X2 [Mizuhopecten yessoensis]